MDNTVPQDTHQDKPLTTFIYGLKCPVAECIRYVGKSNNPQRRFRDHLRDKQDTHKSRWIHGLQAQGMIPALIILEEVPYEQWEHYECLWIQVFHDQGCLLTNSDEGGKGGNPTPAVRAKISKANKGKQRAPEHKAAVAKANKIRVVSPETRDKMSKSHKGRTLLKGRNHTPEARAKMSATHRGKKQSPEHVAKRSDARRGVKRSPESIEKQASTLRGSKHTSESLAKMSEAKKLWYTTNQNPMKGKAHTSETKAKLSVAKKGTKQGPLTEEQRRKVGDALRGKKQTPEHIAKRAEARRGTSLSAEARANMSAAQKRRNAMKKLPPSDTPTLWD